MHMALQNIYKENIEIQYINSFQQNYYPILASLIVDYKGQKPNIQYFIYYVSPKKRKCDESVRFTKLWVNLGKTWIIEFFNEIGL